MTLALELQYLLWLKPKQMESTVNAWQQLLYSTPPVTELNALPPTLVLSELVLVVLVLPVRQMIRLCWCQTMARQIRRLPRLLEPRIVPCLRY